MYNLYLTLLHLIFFCHNSLQNCEKYSHIELILICTVHKRNVVYCVREKLRDNKITKL